MNKNFEFIIEKCTDFDGVDYLEFSEKTTGFTEFSATGCYIYALQCHDLLSMDEDVSAIEAELMCKENGIIVTFIGAD